MVIYINNSTLKPSLVKPIIFLFITKSGQGTVSRISLVLYLKGVFAKNERGYRLNAIKKRLWSLLILLLSVAKND